MTFKYSVKEFNLYGDTYVKQGYDIAKLTLNDCVCIIDNQLIAIQTNTSVISPLPAELLGKPFEYKDGEYRTKRSPKTIISCAALRNDLYENGFICDGIRYVRFKRSSGSARVGKCLFINERLYHRIHKWELCGLKIKEGQEVDLAALESYIALTTSSIIDTLNIKPENILVVDDYVSSFEDNVIATTIENGTLISKLQKAKIKNSIWDGQSLIDNSALGKYKRYGMVLLRNQFFKSCCFNTNIQKWFSDYGIHDVKELNGVTLAKNIGDIKLITTPSSIKYLKFGTLQQWLGKIEPIFGVVKHEKPPHFFDGGLVQTHYQLLNTLQLSKKEMQNFLEPALDFIRLLKTEPAVVKHYIKYPLHRTMEQTPMLTQKEIVFNLMDINSEFYKTKIYQNFLNTLIVSYYNSIKSGHVLVNGNYSTLLGNPIEMLQQAIGKFDGKSQLGIGNIHSKRFSFHQNILCCRSPHVTMGNILVANNSDNSLIDKYCNLTEEIVCINSINENTLQRLSGADFDSDTILLTDDSILIKAAEKNYKIFQVPTSLVEAKKTVRTFTAQQKADLDIKTSVNKIGEIVNFSQILNSLYWNRVAHGRSHKENHDLYCDITKLDVLSGIEIDKAKKEFEVNTVAELNKLRKKYIEILTDSATEKTIRPYFFAYLAKRKGYYNPQKKIYLRHETSMDFLQTVVNSYRVRITREKEYIPFSQILNRNNFIPSRINYDKVNTILSAVSNYTAFRKKIWNTEYSYSNKLMLCLSAKEDCINTINFTRLNFSSMYYLLTLIEDEKYSHLRSSFLNILFCICNNSFFNMLKVSQQKMIPYLDTKSGEIIKIFNKVFYKNYKFGARTAIND